MGWLMKDELDIIWEDPGGTEKITKTEPGYPVTLLRLDPTTYRVQF
jgi:hypothetical protein